jgi:hypothetical protein
MVVITLVMALVYVLMLLWVRSSDALAVLQPLLHRLPFSQKGSSKP